MLIDAVKVPCQICRFREATERHHIFPQHKDARKRYGALLDEDFNILPVCSHCHASHREIAGRVEGEMWFRNQAEILGFPLPPAGKVLQGKTRFGRG